MNPSRNQFRHQFLLHTSDGNTCVQPVLAMLERTGFLRWHHHVPAQWVHPPSERDNAEWRTLVEQSADSTRQLADAFYFAHLMEDKL